MRHWAYPCGTISSILPALYYEAVNTIAEQQRGQANTAILQMDKARSVSTILNFNPS
jgi:hypothetical protein